MLGLLPFGRLGSSKRMNPVRVSKARHSRARRRSGGSLIEGLEMRRLLSSQSFSAVTTTTAAQSFLNSHLSPDSVTDLTNHGLDTGSNWRFVPISQSLSIPQF